MAYAIASLPCFTLLLISLDDAFTHVLASLFVSKQGPEQWICPPTN
ncbi:hypothetical protein ACLPHM_02610 [Paenalcaligenes sp. Me131]